MAKINSLLDVGRRGMAVSQSALQTTSHNIANKATEGFSRQRVEVETSPPSGDGASRVGNGAKLSTITRTNNPWLEKQLEKEGSNFAFMEGRSGALQKLELVVNEQSVKGLSNSMSEFFNSFRELANNPESLTARTVVRDNATSMIKTFQDMDRQIASVTGELNHNIAAGIEDVNANVKEIARLNEKISSIELAGGGAVANDERDRRDLLVKKLSEKIDITHAEDPKSGMLNITAGKTGILVAGTSSYKLKTFHNADNQTQVIYETSEKGLQTDITEQFKRGSLGGSIELRDGLVNELRDNLQDLSYNIASEVNKAHMEGFDRYNKQGEQFFSLPTNGSYSLDDLKVNKNITVDVSRIAASARPNAPGDNTTANVIHSLQFKGIMGDGTSTFDDFYNSKVGQVGVMSQKAQASLESQKNIVDQMKSMRESVSGVSLDEEAQKMIEYQKSFEASARIIKMADEMFDTVLNLKRM